jgi:MFS family permease
MSSDAQIVSEPLPPPTASLPRQRVQWLALAAMCLVYFLSYFHRAAVPGSIFNQIQSDLSLPATAITALAAILLYSYASVQLFVGLCADRFGGVRVLVVGGLLMSAGAILFPLCSAPWALYLCRCMTGLGAGFMYLSILREIAIMFPARHFAVLVGAVGFVGFAGGMAATLPLERVVRVFGWRHALLGAGVLTLASVLLAAGLLRRLALPRRRGPALSLRPLRDIVTNRRCWPLLGISLLNFPIYFVIQVTIGKKLLEDSAGLSSGAAASVALLMMITAAGATLSGGLLPPLFGHRRRPVLLLASSFIILGTALLLVGVLVAAAAWVLPLAYVLLAAASCATAPLAAVMRELNAPHAVAVAIGLPNTLSYIGAAALANLAGLIIDRFQASAVILPDHTLYPPAAYATLFAVLLGLSVLSLVCSSLVPETAKP